MSHNVRLANLFSTTETASMSMRSGDVLSMYILLLTGGRTDTVGFIQGINGVLQLAAALPSGWLADKIRRDRVLLLAAIIGLGAGLCMAWALFTDQAVFWIGVGMLLLGCYKGFYNPPLEAIFADSLVTGRARDKAYTTRYILQNLANCLGPLQGIILFAFLGNSWKLEDCRVVLRVGICLIVIPLLLLVCFDDRKSLGLRSESIASITRARSAADMAQAEQGGRPGNRCCTCVSPSIMVPAIITLSDLFAALASGMATKFYIVFFVQECGMKPVYSSSLGIASPISICLFSALVNCLGQYCDRIQITLVTKAMDFVLLGIFALLPAGEETRELLVALHLIRSGVANSSRPALRSLMMDHVDKKHRGKWNAVDSLRSVSWSGSAMLGGFLIQNVGYQGTFLISAAMKLAGWVLLLGLFPLIGRGCCSGIAVNKDSEDPLLDSDEEDLLSAHNSPRGPDATGDPTFAWAHRAELSPAADDQSAGDGVPLIHDRASCKEQS